MIEWFFFQASQALGVLAFVGVLAAIYRWDKALRRDFLMAFVIFLVGTSLREGVVYQWGNQQWSEFPLLLSAFARVLQIGGAVLFIRYATRDVCPAWVMAAFLVLLALFVMAV